MSVLDHARIAALIPHAGTMCLLDRALDWNATSIVCTATSHRDPKNPLRRADGRLGTLAGIEFAGQAMALHGALTTAQETEPRARPRLGYLASLRNVQFDAEVLDSDLAELVITIAFLMGDTNGATYHFFLTQNDLPRLQGRATVLFQAAT